MRARKRMSKSAGAVTGSRLPTSARRRERSARNSAHDGHDATCASAVSLKRWPNSELSISSRTIRQSFAFIFHHLNVIAHLVAQKVSRAINARLNGSCAGSEDLGNLVIALALDVAQHQ